MEPQHEQTLKNILQKNKGEFSKWVDSLSDEELVYVEWLLEKADGILDEMLLEKTGLVEANNVLKNIMRDK